MAKPAVQPRIFKGTRDFLPADMIRREAVLKVVREVFERYGFEPLETPSLEYWDVLTGKYGEEGEKLIYRLAYKDNYTLALRYDLTVPLARVVAMNPELPKPFKRYQIQPVWRADRPQKGRYREFYQCDVDTVGSASLLADAENVAVIAEVLSRLDMPPFTIRVSSRQLLYGLAAYAGVRGKTLSVPDRAGVGAKDANEPPPMVDVPAPTLLFRSIDKADKIGPDGVAEEMKKLGFDDTAIGRTREILEAAPASNDDAVALARRLVGDDPDGVAGVAEVEAVLQGARDLGAPDERLKIDLSLARGLDYYSGPIYETVVDEPKIGSVSAGGRYDGLIEVFGGRPVPAAGVSLGLGRIVTVLDELGRLPAAKTRTEALVAQLGDGMTAETARVAADLRAAGVRTEMRYEPSSIRSQLGYAEKRGIPFVVIVAPDEIARGEVGVRDMTGRTQDAVPRAEVGARVAALARARYDAGEDARAR